MIIRLFFRGFLRKIPEGLGLRLLWGSLLSFLFYSWFKVVIARKHRTVGRMLTWQSFGWGKGLLVCSEMLNFRHPGLDPGSHPVLLRRLGELVFEDLSFLVNSQNFTSIMRP